ncbi:MAG TPA: RidA family protein [Candidatus Limnocylindrales bacterium]|nr:RidA family protein [Candidatus Limnocylindrales bacterium]
MEKRVINPWTWQDAMGFVQANEVKGATRTLVVSGQTSVDGDGAPLHKGDMSAQIVQALDNLETVLSAAGFSLSDVVRVTYYTTDVDAFIEGAGAGVGRLVGAGCRTASTLLGVARLFHPDILVEIEATAMA